VADKRIESLRERVRELEASEDSAKLALARASASLAEHRRLLDKAILDEVIPVLGSIDKSELDASTVGLDKRAVQALNRLKEVIG